MSHFHCVAETTQFTLYFITTVLCDFINYKSSCKETIKYLRYQEHIA